MRDELEKIVRFGPGDVSDHIRQAIQGYIEAHRLDLSLHLRRVKTEFKASIGQEPGSEAMTVVWLVDHWDRTKKDSYGIGK